MWSNMVTHTQNLCSAFNPSKCTHTVVNTHTHSEHTPGAVGTGQPMLQRPGSRTPGGSVPCSRVSTTHLVQLWYWRWRERRLFTPPTNNSCRTWDSNLRPSGYKSDSLSIKPWLPPYMMWFQVFLCLWSVTSVRAYVRSVNLQRLKSQTQRRILCKSSDSSTPS